MSTSQTKGTKEHETINIHGSKKEESTTTTSKYAKFKKQEREMVIIWVEITVFLVAITCCALSLSVPSLKQVSIRGFELWQLCLLITALVAGPVISKGISHLILFLINRDISIKENLIYYIIGLAENAWVVLWFSMILLAWIWVMDEPSYLGVSSKNKQKLKQKFAYTEHIITLTLITILLGSFLWLVKDLLIMTGKSTFHIRRFFDRICESLEHEYRIKTLSYKQPEKSEPSERAQNVNFEVKDACGKTKIKEIDLSSLKKVNQESVSCWTMKILIDGIIMDRGLEYMDHGENQVKNIDDEGSAKKAAQIICSNLELDRSSLATYFAEDYADKVNEWLLDGMNNKKIEAEHNYPEIKNRKDENKKKEEEAVTKCVIRAWKYRSALVRALKDNKELFKQLNMVVDVALVIAIFIVWLVMVNVEFQKAIVVAGSAIVGSAVIFGDFCKKMLTCFSFVFIEHPFDVGDCCLIEDTPVIIDKIMLLTTNASTLDAQSRFYPNSLLCEKSITNYTRSSTQMGESVVFAINVGTKAAKIDKLRDQIQRYIKSNSRYWAEEHDLVLEFDEEDLTKIKATLFVKHNIKYDDYRERQARKSKLVSDLQVWLNEPEHESGSSTQDQKQVSGSSSQGLR